MSQPDNKSNNDDDKSELELNMSFFSPEDFAELLPPEEVSITELTAEPYEDGQRIRVNIEISPFEKRPHLTVTLSDTKKQEISQTSFVEPMTWKLEFTMHLRTEPAKGPLDLEARLFYPDGPEAEPLTARFDLPQT